MKLKELYNFDQAVALMIKNQVDFKLAYRLTKLVKKMENEVESIIASQKSLFNKYGEDEEGQLVIKPNKIDKYNKDFNEILDQEVEFEFEPIPMELLEKQEKIATEVLIKLYPFTDDKDK